MVKIVESNKIQELVSMYYERMKSAIDFQIQGNIIEYTKNLIEAKNIEDQLNLMYVRN